MKRLLSLILAISLITSCAALFAACGEEKADNFPVSVGGAEIEAEPERVVVLNDAFADILLYMGYDTKLVGRSITCDQLILNVLPSVGYPAEPAVDTLIKLEPDLIIADDTLSAKARKSMAENDIPVAILETSSNQDDIKQLYIDLATALEGNNDGSKKGEETYEKLFDLLDEYNTATKDIVVTDAYLYLDEEGNYCTFVKDSLEEKIFSYNGAMNVFGTKTSPAFHAADITDDKGNVTQADEMYIRYANPTYLFLDGTVAKDGTINSAVYDKLLGDPNLKNLSALKQKRISFIPKKNFYRPGVTFEETLFTMIDVLNKDEEAAEASAATTTPTTSPAPTQAPTKAPATKAPTKATEAPADEETPEDDGGEAVADDGGEAVADDGGEAVADDGGEAVADDGGEAVADDGGANVDDGGANVDDGGVNADDGGAYDNGGEGANEGENGNAN